MDNISDYLLWYARDIDLLRYVPLYMRKDLLAMDEQDFTCRRSRSTAAVAYQQGLVQLHLQAADEAAKRGLIGVQYLGGPGEAAMHCDVHEGLQLSQLHVHSSYVKAT